MFIDLFQPVCFDLPILSQFCIGARIDITTLTHFVGGFVMVLVFYNIFRVILKHGEHAFFLAVGLSIGFMLGEEIAQGSCSVQGFDLIDLAAGLLGFGLFVVVRARRSAVQA